MSSASSTIFSIVVFLQKLLKCLLLISFHAGVLLKNNIAEEFFITGFALEFHFLLSQSMDGG
jgi:hypothetical protein